MVRIDRIGRSRASFALENSSVRRDREQPLLRKRLAAVWDKPRSADAVENKVAVAGIPNCLASTGRDDHHIAWSNSGGDQVADRDYSTPIYDQISPVDTLQTIQLCSHPGRDSGSSNRHVWVGSIIP